MDDTRLTFHDHLGELRTRLVRTAIAVAGGFFVAWALREPLFDLLSAPVREGLANNGIYRLTAIEVTETIFVYLKLSLIAGLAIAAPVVFWQVWAFIAPGLHRHEKQYVLPITIFSVLFFFLGVLFCHRVLLPFVTDFLVEMTLDHPDVSLQVTVQNAFSFALSLLLAFGLAFELPLFIFFLSILGFATPRGLIRFFRYFLVLAFVVGALLTPPDPVSQLMMAGPLIALYLVGIGLSALAVRQKARSGRGTLSIGSWALVGIVLMAIVGGLGYASWMLGRTPSTLDHVPASARLVAGLRWADAKNRAALDDTLEAWTNRHPAAPKPDDVLRSVGLSLGGDDETPVSEVLVYVTMDGRTAVLLAGDFRPDSLSATAERLGADWVVSDDSIGTTLRRADAADDDPSALVAVRLAPDVVAVGERAAIEAGDRASAAGAALSSVAHRRDAVEGVRRAGPLWIVAWRDPIVSSDLFGLLVGSWDQPLAKVWTELSGEVTVHATVVAPSPGAAARFARELDQWRDRQSARELRAAAERARVADSRRTTERLGRLAAAVEGVVRATRSVVATAEPGAEEALQGPLAELQALRKELDGEVAARATEPTAAAGADVDPPARDVPRLEASAEGPVVTLEARLTPQGAASVADRLVRWMGDAGPDQDLFETVVAR